MPLSEFQLIQRYFTQPGLRGDPVMVVCGIGDDCALLKQQPGMELAVAIDTLVEGVHFPADMAPQDIGYRALAVNLSDLAAMGATPSWFTLALTMPTVNETWLEQFAAGLLELAMPLGMALVGGDTTRGPLCMSVQVAGQVTAGQALLRSGAKAGDVICVTGCPGDAAAGLAQWRQPGADSYLAWRFTRPSPRLVEAQLLRSRASACIDISDGLLADLGHILSRSGVGASIEVDCLPLSAALRAWPDQAQAMAWALSGGDDYELCFTVPEAQLASLHEAFEGAACSFTVIGRVERAVGLHCYRADGSRYLPVSTGYEHFK